MNNQDFLFQHYKKSTVWKTLFPNIMENPKYT